MHDQAIYRCINQACGRPAPRPVNVCPWCGTAQARAGTQESVAMAAKAAPAAAAPATAAPRPGRADAPPAPASPPGLPAPASPPGPPAPASPAGPAGPAARAAAVPGASPVPRPLLAAHPPARAPVRLRWWLLALALLWGLWLLAEPETRKIERQVEAAVALARECKGIEAQAGLIALRKTRATPEQLQRLQRALNDEASRCAKRRQRGRENFDNRKGGVE